MDDARGQKEGWGDGTRAGLRGQVWVPEKLCKALQHTTSCNPLAPKYSDVRGIIIPIFQMRKPRNREELNTFSTGHRARIATVLTRILHS